MRKFAVFILLAGLVILAWNCGRAVDDVVTDTTPPTIASHSPASGEAQIPRNAKISVTFSEEMDSASITTSTFFLRTAAGGSVVGSVSYSAKTAVLTPSATLESSTLYEVIVSSDLKDAVGNRLANTYQFSFQSGTQVYVDSPSIESVVPANGSINVSPAIALAANFNRRMESQSVKAGFTLKTLGGAAVTGSVTLSANSQIAYFTPAAALSNGTTYEVTLASSIKDIADNALASAYTWSFTVLSSGGQPDTVSPSIEARSPAANATGITTTTEVAVTFSEAMNPATINSTTFTLSSAEGAVSGTVTYDAGTRRAIFRLAVNLAFSTTYTATVTAGVQDLTGNLLAAAVTWSFTTKAAWLQQTSGTSARLHDVHFLDVDNGWVVGQDGTILRTTNGGSSWASVTSPTTAELTRLSFINSTTAWAAGLGMGGLPSPVLTYNGTNWSVLNTHVNRWFMSVHFVSATTGWAVGLSSLSEGGVILKTTNGGTSWTSQETSNTINDLYMINSTTGFVVGDNGTILRTTDGDNWSSQTSNTSQQLNAVHFLDANNGWAVGAGGTILNTTNGGTIWTAQTSGVASSLAAVYFLDANNGWVGGGGSLLHTTNGGVTWTSVSGVTGSLSDLYFINANRGWAVGLNGVIWSYSP